MIYDRSNNEYYENQESKFLVFMYNTIPGRVVLKVATRKWVSATLGLYMVTPISKLKIKKFIKKNKIDMDEYEKTKYKNFDKFFVRNIKPDKRPIPGDKHLFISPCDSKLSVYKIDSNTNINVKNSSYTISELLKDNELAEKYKDGYCLVFRLCVDDYHHYHFIDDGEVIKHKKIKGVLNTVRPVALKAKKVFSENNREWTLLSTKTFGNMIYMEVGAIGVGKIVNLKVDKFKRGDEKGYFRFGGSTVILLIEKDILELDQDILDEVSKDNEVQIKLFEPIGRRI
jgi:phosphatidylserine decarboxylase